MRRSLPLDASEFKAVFLICNHASPHPPPFLGIARIAGLMKRLDVEGETYAPGKTLL
jgi:hypothetical protein